MFPIDVNLNDSLENISVTSYLFLILIQKTLFMIKNYNYIYNYNLTNINI